MIYLPSAVESRFSLPMYPLLAAPFVLAVWRLGYARGKPVPQYRVVATHGAPHERSFEVECAVDGGQTVGKGTSRQRAEQEAARAMLDKLAG